MKWKRGSDQDVIDVRGGGGGGGGAGMPGGRIAIPGGLGLVGVIVVVALQLLGGGSGAFDVPAGFDNSTQAPTGSAIPADQDPEADLKAFSSYVFNDAQATWAKTFSEQGRPYKRAQLVLYRNGIDTGCGSASSAVGPFYCPQDQRVYLDLSFYRDMQQKLGAPGDFAWAYVIAHEMGHHVQKQLGTDEKVRQLQSQDRSQVNPLSVRLELQADCYAGVWAQHVYQEGDLEDGDVQEAITASEAVGDDRLQREATGQVHPDSFTHGTSAQRHAWFEKGRTAGEPAACDTFTPDNV